MIVRNEIIFTDETWETAKFRHSRDQYIRDELKQPEEWLVDVGPLKIVVVGRSHERSMHLV